MRGFNAHFLLMLNTLVSAQESISREVAFNGLIMTQINFSSHCRKKIGDLLIVSQQIQIIRSSLGIKIAQFVEH